MQVKVPFHLPYCLNKITPMPLPSCCAVHAESDSYMGVIKLPETADSGKRYHRRIDIKVYPPEQYAFALLYFTGSDHFNRSMRYYAKKLGWEGNRRQGYSLSDKGITWATYDKVPPSRKYEKVSEGEINKI